VLRVGAQQRCARGSRRPREIAKVVAKTITGGWESGRGARPGRRKKVKRAADSGQKRLWQNKLSNGEDYPVPPSSARLGRCCDRSSAAFRDAVTGGAEQLDDGPAASKNGPRAVSPGYMVLCKAHGLNGEGNPKPSQTPLEGHNGQTTTNCVSLICSLLATWNIKPVCLYGVLHCFGSAIYRADTPTMERRVVKQLVAKKKKGNRPTGESGSNRANLFVACLPTGEPRTLVLGFTPPLAQRPTRLGFGPGTFLPATERDQTKGGRGDGVTCQTPTVQLKHICSPMKQRHSPLHQRGGRSGIHGRGQSEGDGSVE